MLGRLPFVGERLFRVLVEEAARQWPHGRPGDGLARLAVSRQLREAVSAAVGYPVVSTGQALYQYHASVAAHRDKAGYDLVLHMVVAGEGSVLEVYDEAGTVAERVEVGPGECVVLRGGEVLHGWGPVDEGRTLIAAGFREQEQSMPDEENDKQDVAEDVVEVPDLDVTEESGEAVKGGVPTVIDV